jgi:hypothetical protein
LYATTGATTSTWLGIRAIHVKVSNNNLCLTYLLLIYPILISLECFKIYDVDIGVKYANNVMLNTITRGSQGIHLQIAQMAQVLGHSSWPIHVRAYFKVPTVPMNKLK